ncbi:hypothetical protein QQG55_16030 [Brugia pahangi]
MTHYLQMHSFSFVSATRIEDLYNRVTATHISIRKSQKCSLSNILFKSSNCSKTKTSSLGGRNVLKHA